MQLSIYEYLHVCISMFLVFEFRFLGWVHFVFLSHLITAHFCCWVFISIFFCYVFLFFYNYFVSLIIWCINWKWLNAFQDVNNNYRRLLFKYMFDVCLYLGCFTFSSSDSDFMVFVIFYDENFNYEVCTGIPKKKKKKTFVSSYYNWGGNLFGLCMFVVFVAIL